MGIFAKASVANPTLDGGLKAEIRNKFKRLKARGRGKAEAMFWFSFVESFEFCFGFRISIQFPGKAGSHLPAWFLQLLAHPARSERAGKLNGRRRSAVPTG